MAELHVEVTNHGRAFIYVDDSSQTYSYDRSEGFRDGKGTHVSMWMQGARSIESFVWKEEYPFPLLQEKFERIAQLDFFKTGVAFAIDAELPQHLRKRSLALAARTMANWRHDDTLGKIDWSQEFLPKVVVWDIVPKDVPISDIFAKVKEVIDAAKSQQ